MIHRITLTPPDEPRADGESWPAPTILVRGVESISHTDTHRTYLNASATPIATIPEDLIQFSEILKPTIEN